ncbi:hypothetical protein PQX77_008927 [Marasmius sp. AFHP31]|nr:hypothetical protein PQX77_008927 [Marasmius sp. AFHP31]
MSHQAVLSYFPADDQRNVDGADSLAMDAYSMSSSLSWRDSNVNNGSGTFTINNDNRVIQQSRSTWRHIRGTEEEEAEYEEYGEYKRGDIRLLERIYHERRERFDHQRGQFTACERNIFIGQVVAGDGIGKIVTVEAFAGHDAPEAWKKSFAYQSVRTLCVNSAHLVALNRSKVPLLIFSDGLVPIAHFTKSGWLAGLYFYLLGRSSQLAYVMRANLWVDPTRGVICRGPSGPPDSKVRWRRKTRLGGVKNLPLTTDLLQGDVFLRFLASQKNSKDVDQLVVQAMWESYIISWETVGMHDPFNQPIVFSTLTQTPIAIVYSPWENRRGNLVEKKVLENGWTRFRLHGDATYLELSWYLSSSSADWSRAWIAQASSIFHSLGISLEGDLSTYQLIWRNAKLRGFLDGSPSKSQRRHLQPIYLFVLPHPPVFNSTWLHFWSFHEDGQSRLSPESCLHFGLPTQLYFNNYSDRYLYSWTTVDYKCLHEYQLSRGFDPKTTDFARHLGYVDYIFHPINDSDRFKEVYEEQQCASGSSESNVNVGSEDLLNTRAQGQQPVGDADCCGDLQIQAVPCNRKDKSRVSGDHIANNTEPGELESGSRPDQDLPHRDVTVSNDIAADGPARPRSPESTSGCDNSAANSLAGNVTDGVDTSPRIQSAVDSTVIASHDINNTQNVGGVEISHVSQSGDTDNRVHGDGSALQLAPSCRQIRLFTPFTSLIPRVLSATPCPFLTDLRTSFESFLFGSSAALRYSQRCRIVSGLPLEDQDGDRALD